MKAVAAFPGKRDIRVIDHPEPRIERPTGVKVRVLDVGVCGTDKEIAHFDYGTPPVGSEYLVIGHESLSEVIEAGPAVKGFDKGDLVVMTVRRPCPHPECMACRVGRQDFCYTGDFTERGIKQHHGYMTEFVVEDAQYLHKAPAGMRDIAVLTEPLTIAEKALTQLFQVQARLPWACPAEPGRVAKGCDHAVVLGAGPVGLLGAMALALHGFEVTVYSRSPEGGEQQDIVKAIGARYVAAETNSVDDLVRQVGSIDVVYEAIGASSVAFDVIRRLGTNGVFIFTGVPGRKEPIPVDTDLIMRDMVLKNQLIFGTVNAPPEAFETAIADLAEFRKRWPDAVSKLITKRYPIDGAIPLLQGKAGGIKNVVAVGA
ncbi:MAG TPA: glucose 1-dehydrogenase [Bryobacteraceae bacterium]|nr:glucose 1-dehydrogenase [Bryobacteraceae bacterium]